MFSCRKVSTIFYIILSLHEIILPLSFCFCSNTIHHRNVPIQKCFISSNCLPKIDKSCIYLLSLSINPNTKMKAYRHQNEKITTNQLFLTLYVCGNQCCHISNELLCIRPGLFLQSDQKYKHLNSQSQFQFLGFTMYLISLLKFSNTVCLNFINLRCMSFKPFRFFHEFFKEAMYAIRRACQMLNTSIKPLWVRIGQL